MLDSVDFTLLSHIILFALQCLVFLCEIFVLILFTRFFIFFAEKKFQTMLQQRQKVTKKHRFVIFWVSTLLIFYFLNLVGRSYYRPYLVYCTHWTYSIDLQEYIRDLVVPTGNFLISMSILYMYYH